MERIATDEDGGVSGLDSRTALNLSVTSTSATQGTQAVSLWTVESILKAFLRAHFLALQGGRSYCTCLHLYHEPANRGCSHYQPRVWGFRQLFQAKKLTIGDKEALLQQLSADGWLHSDRGTFKLGVRTFLELGTYLHSLELSERTKELWADLI